MFWLKSFSHLILQQLSLSNSPVITCATVYLKLVAYCVNWLVINAVQTVATMDKCETFSRKFQSHSHQIQCCVCLNVKLQQPMKVAEKTLLSWFNRYSNGMKTSWGIINTIINKKQNPRIHKLKADSKFGIIWLLQIVPFVIGLMTSLLILGPLWLNQYQRLITVLSATWEICVSDLHQWPLYCPQKYHTSAICWWHQPVF